MSKTCELVVNTKIQGEDIANVRDRFFKFFQGQNIPNAEKSHHAKREQQNYLAW